VARDLAGAGDLGLWLGWFGLLSLQGD